MKTNEIKNILFKLNSFPKRRMGQNFLSDEETAKRIIKCLPDKIGGVLIEIGPGLGALTKYILEKYRKNIILVEKDKNISNYLSKTYSDIKIINNDFLKLEFDDLLKGDENWIVGNLPYNISKQILRKIIDNRMNIQGAVLTLQKEVASRLTALPRCKDYAAITVLFAFISSVKTQFDIEKEYFYPKPKVTSSVIKIDIDNDRAEKLFKDFDFFKKIVKICFMHRRKNLRNNLKRNFSSDLMNNIKIDLRKRAEELTLNEFIELSRILNV